MDIKKYTSIIIFKKHLVYKSVLDAILLHVKYIYILNIWSNELY